MKADRGLWPFKDFCGDLQDDEFERREMMWLEQLPFNLRLLIDLDLVTDRSVLTRLLDEARERLRVLKRKFEEVEISI